MKAVLAALFAATVLAGCVSTAADHKFVPGENFAAGKPGAGILGFNPTAGEKRCGTKQQVDGRVPWCDWPKDGDGYE